MIGSIGMKQKVAAVIVCAGKGKRLGKKDKATLKIGSKPIFYPSVSVFRKIKQIKQIILVLRKKNFALAAKYIKQGVILVEGGKERRDSVLNGLVKVGKDINYVLVHDGARPFITKELVLKVLKELKKYPAVVPAVAATDTLKLVKKGVVKKTLDRKCIYAVQTPQGFKKDLLLKAYKTVKKKVTDDAKMIELLNKTVRVIAGDPHNFKITYLQDLKLAKAINYARL